MTAIIFGVHGQDGYYLTELLQQQNIQVVGCGRINDEGVVVLHHFDRVCELVKKYKPDFIFHLAANSTTRHEVLFENHLTIETGPLHILEAVRLYSPQTKVFISGSGLQFHNNGLPINENNVFEASSAYAVSRIQSVYAARYYRTLGINVYVGYFFNHDSPKRTERHMSKKIAEAAKRISNGSVEKLEIGDINVVKEWTFAGDVVAAIWRLVNQSDIFEACIGSGKGYSIKDWLQVCFDAVGLDWRQCVIQKENYVSEYKSLVSDPSLLFSMGWKPLISFEDLAQKMMK